MAISSDDWLRRGVEASAIYSCDVIPYFGPGASEVRSLNSFVVFGHFSLMGDPTSQELGKDDVAGVDITSTQYFFNMIINVPPNFLWVGDASVVSPF